MSGLLNLGAAAEALFPSKRALQSLQKGKQGRMGCHGEKIPSLNIEEVSKGRRQAHRMRSLGEKLVSLGQ